MSKKNYKCKECGNIQEVSTWGEIMHPHLMFKEKKILIKCSKCNRLKWHKRIEE